MNVQEGSLKINEALNNTLNDFLRFPLSEAIAGRRARRFCVGSEIPDGVLSFKSKHDPLPLSEIEQLLLLSYMGGVTGWHDVSFWMPEEFANAVLSTLKQYRYSE